MFQDMLSLAGKLPLYNLRRSRNRPSPPDLLILTVTWKCNYQCTMCDVWKFDDFSQELTLEDYRRLLADPVLAKTRVVRVTGGEPFARRDMEELALLIAGMPSIRVFYLNTNGYYTERTARTVEKVLAANPKLKMVLATSIDGAALRHDALRGRSGLLDKTVETLRALAEVRRRNPRLEVAVLQVVMRENREDIGYVADLAREHGALYDGTLGIKIDGGNLFANFRQQSARPSVDYVPYDDLTPEEVDGIIAALERAMGLNGAGVGSLKWVKDLTSHYFFDGLRQRLKREPERLNPPCHSLFTNLRVMPRGEVITCMIFNGELANVKRRTLSEIWHGDTLAEARRQVRKCPGCWVGCEVTPNAVYSGDLLKYGVRRVLGGGRPAAEVAPPLEAPQASA